MKRSSGLRHPNMAKIVIGGRSHGVRAQTDHADIATRVFDPVPCRAGVGDDGVLGGRVGWHNGHGAEALHGGHVQDGAALLCAHPLTAVRAHVLHGKFAAVDGALD